MKRAAFLLLMVATYMKAAPMKVHIVTDVPSPQPVGTVIGLTARVDGGAKGSLAVRFDVSENGGPFQLLSDYSRDATFAWAPELYEHESKLRVMVLNQETKETAEAELVFRMTPRKMGADGTVTPTTNPLVALFSAPACAVGGKFQVAFHEEGSSAVSHTPLMACRGTVTNNVYVAGMHADSVYVMRSEVSGSADTKTGKWLPFHTGMVDGNFLHVETTYRDPGLYSTADGIIVRSGDAGRTVATDLDGRLVWFLNARSDYGTRLLGGGRLLAIMSGTNSANDIHRAQMVREIDLAGNTLRVTNASRVAEQLAKFGIHSDCKEGGKECLSGFHHEATRLPNGHTLVIAGLERMEPAETQGSKEPVDVLGDAVIDLDENFQVSWIWNSFDHMDLKRASLGKAHCMQGEGRGGCPPVFLAKQANGWLHSNAVSYMPEDGNFVISIPEQDWVVKVDYENGKGSGKVLWRLGKDGDFKTNSADPYPWFSFQHDAGPEAGSGLLLMLDDGHRRKDIYKDANNRGQAWAIDEKTHTATPVMNLDLGEYSVAVGSAQKLANGDYSFESGFILGVPPRGPAKESEWSQTTEVTPEGKITFKQRADGSLTYRSFRVPDMYTPPTK
jgi:arylsulfate sulfotransferase